MRVALTHNLKRSTAEAEAEFDTPETIAALCRAITAAGHEAIPVEVTASMEIWLPQLCAVRPNVVLNTAEGTRGTARTALFPAVFESLNLCYTGSDPRAQVLTQDKHLTKQCVAAAGVAVAAGVFLARPDLPHVFPAGPVIIKPNFEGSSKGITEASVVTDPAELPARLAACIAHFPEGVLVEEFIPGTDVTVGFFEGLSQPILTPCSYLVAPAWANRHRLYDFHLKNRAPDEAVQVACPALCPAATLEIIRAAALQVVHCLGLRGVARLDFRVRDDGAVFFVEANATPSLESGSSIFVALQSVGIDFPSAIRHLIEHAANRHTHEHPSP